MHSLVRAAGNLPCREQLRLLELAQLPSLEFLIHNINCSNFTVMPQTSKLQLQHASTIIYNMQLKVHELKSKLIAAGKFDLEIMGSVF